MKDKKYWQTKAEEELIEVEQSVLDYENTLGSLYDYMELCINKNIHSFFSEYGTNNVVTYSLTRYSLNPKQLKQFKSQVDNWIKEIDDDSKYCKHLKDLKQKSRITRLDALLEEIIFNVEFMKRGQESSMLQLAKEGYLASYYNIFYDTLKGIEDEAKYETLSDTDMMNGIKEKWNGHNYSTDIWKDRDKLVDGIKLLIPQSLARGLTADKMMELISKQIKTSLNRAKTTARTELNRIQNSAKLTVYKIIGVETYIYTAILDMKTSEICRDLDGYVGRVDNAEVGVNYPPMHPNCRSTTLPNTESLPNYRMAEDSEGNLIKVPRSMTQEEWIRKYVPESQQEKLLKFKNKYRPN